MFNVSFGRFIYNEERGARRTPQQRKCIDYVGDMVDDPYKENELANNLEKKKGADLCMDVNKNGTIDLYVKKEMLARQEYIPYDKNGKKRLFTRINVNSPLSTIKKQVETFVKKCNDYAQNLNCKKNEDIEIKNQEDACSEGSSLRIAEDIKDEELYEQVLQNSWDIEDRQL